MLGWLLFIYGLTNSIVNSFTVYQAIESYFLKITSYRVEKVTTQQTPSMATI